MRVGFYFLILCGIVSCTHQRETPPQLYGKWIVEDADITFYKKKYQNSAAETEYKKATAKLKKSLENSPVKYLIYRKDSTLITSEDTDKISFWKYENATKEICFSNTKSFASQSCNKILDLSNSKIIFRSELPDIGYIIFTYKKVKN